MSDTNTTAAAGVVTDTGGTQYRRSGHRRRRHRRRNDAVCAERPDPPTRPSPPRSTYLEYRRRQRRADPTCRNLLIPYPQPPSSLAPSTGAIQERARKSARGCGMTVDTKEPVRRSRPGSEALQERQHKLSAGLHRWISKHGVGSTYEEESDISVDESEHTDTHVNHRHLAETTSRLMDSYATPRRARKTSRPRHSTRSQMMAVLEEEEIEPDPPEHRSVDVAAGYSTPPPTP